METPIVPGGHGSLHQAPRRRRRSGRIGRFFRGYLMFVGALTTLYVLVQLLVLVFVELSKWMPAQPVI